MRHKLPDIPEETSLAGKTIMVIGGSSGLGLEFARECLLGGASRVIVTTRDKPKGVAAVNAIYYDPEVEAINPNAILELFHLDLDDYDSASKFLDDVRREVSEIDILLCNAGINQFKYQASNTGHERVMQVNCYSHLFIVLGLLPLLQATAVMRGSPSRVTFVTSFSHTRHTLHANPPTENQSILSYFDDQTKYRGTRRYQDSKLVVNGLMQRLATIVPSDEVIVNAVCPGVVATNLHRNLPWWLKPAMRIYNMIHAKPVKDGAWILLHAAVVTGQESHGKYLQKGEIQGGAPFLSQPAGKELTEKLWGELVAEFKQIRPELGLYAGKVDYN